MSKLILLSVLIALVAIPALTSKDRQGIRGLRRAVVGVALFNAVFLFLLLFVYPRVVHLSE